jgi:hypothetical protein
MSSEILVRSGSEEQRPVERMSRVSWRAKANSFVTIIFGAVIIFFALFGHAWYRTGATGLALRYLGGERIFLLPSHVMLDAQNSANRIDVDFLNLSNETVAVIGARLSCSCLTVNELPVFIPKNEKVSLEVTYSGLAPDGFDSQTVDFFVDREAVPYYRLQISHLHPES